MSSYENAIISAQLFGDVRILLLITATILPNKKNNNIFLTYVDGNVLLLNYKGNMFLMHSQFPFLYLDNRYPTSINCYSQHRVYSISFGAKEKYLGNKLLLI